MNKRLILQVDIAPDNKIQNMKRFRQHRELYDISHHQAKKFATNWNADYMLITDTSFLPEKHAVYQRLKMYDLDYDQILYLDSDAVILDTCPDVFDLWRDNEFCAVKNYRWDTEQQEQKRLRDCEIYGASKTYRPFCSGVMMVSRKFLDKTRNLWQEYINAYDKHGEHDQGIFNKMVILNGEKYTELDEHWGAWYAPGVYIDHLGGPFRKVDFNKDKYVRKMKLTDFYISKQVNDLFDWG